MDAVTAVISQRTRTDESMGSVFGASALAHVVLVVVVAVVPASWLGTRKPEPESVMQLTLGGAPGPATGGVQQESARPTQEVVPIDAKKVLEPVRPPAAKAPEMIEPVKTAPKKSTSPSKVEAKDPRSRTPTKGAELQKGSAVSQTQSRSQSTGLSTSGNNGLGGSVDVANFCCPDYLINMAATITRNWQTRQQGQGTTLMKFVIERDGTLTSIEIERSSGVQTLDYYSQRALMLTRQLPPLPAAYDQPRLTVHLNFPYGR